MKTLRTASCLASACRRIAQSPTHRQPAITDVIEKTRAAIPCSSAESVTVAPGAAPALWLKLPGVIGGTDLA
jgi:hypothetical protein